MLLFFLAFEVIVRRILAFVLVASFLTQSVPAVASAQPSATLSMSNGMQPLLSAIQSTWIFAVITWQGDRYAAMNAPPPTIPKLHDDGTLSTRSNVSTIASARFSTPTAGGGVLFGLPAGTGGRFNVKDAQPDPLAIRKTTTQVRRAAVGPSLRSSRALVAQTGTLAPSGTGANPWWTYEERSLAGVGKAMVNVANGNLIVQAGDVDIPDRGIDLAFRRTWNSQSTHDAVNTDGSVPSIYGEGWTNNFDTHIAYNAASSTMSVYDMDGARYDYLADGNGGWTPPAGMQGTSLVTSRYQAGCYYYWSKKSGTQYQFYAPFSTSCNPASSAALWGRMVVIYGRNGNNHLNFFYQFKNNDASTINNINALQVYNAGIYLWLTFMPVNGHPELASITRPDNHQITYTYDSSGNLLTVSRPGNATNLNLTEEYWYYSGTHQMQWVSDPRCVATLATPQSNCADGSTTGFKYDASGTSGRLTSIDNRGMVNFTPNDGTGAVLQPGSSATNLLWRQTQFVYQGNNFAQMTDTQGHATQWYFNTNGNVIETHMATGT
jgi:YD repeat-containing protein